MIWKFLWKTVLLFTLCGYGILVVIVIFKGIGNIIDMLKDLKAQAPPES
jgi:hypothetical protein